VALLALVAPLLAGADYPAKTNYVLHCQGCHGADGIGGLPEKIPPLRDSIGYFLKVPGGRRFLIQVPGVAQAPLGDAEIAELLNFTLQQHSADQLPLSFRPYTREEVARDRREVADIVLHRSELVATILERFGVQMWTQEDPEVASPTGVNHAAGH